MGSDKTLRQCEAATMQTPAFERLIGAQVVTYVHTDR